MGYFDECSSFDRYSFQGPSTLHGDHGTLRVVLIWDQRTVITVVTDVDDVDEQWFCDALDAYLEEIPADSTQVEISGSGELISCSSDVQYDRAQIPYYPPVTAFPSDSRIIRRSQLTEIERMGIQVDRVAYQTTSSQDREAAFKYYMNRGNIMGFWHELNCSLRIPSHPNILPIDRLVVDSVGGQDKVVGFTTIYIPGGTVESNVSRLFKLKYLRQLLSVLDYLSFELGLAHGDTAIHNLLIDEGADNLKLFDFNLASKVGWEGDPASNGIFGYDKHRSDVKNAIFTVYELITRDAHFREEFYAEDTDISMVMDLRPWQLHPDVRLDADPVEFCRVLDGWVSDRAQKDKDIDHYTKASNPLYWPSLPELPEVYWGGSMVRRASQMRSEMIRRGEDFLEWRRPASRELPLPQGQKLLATGQVVNEITGEVVG